MIPIFNIICVMIKHLRILKRISIVLFEWNKVQQSRYRDCAERTAEGKKRLNRDQEENLHNISKFLKAKFADIN